MTDRGRITLLGTGSSSGVPRVGNDWGACNPDEPRNRRRRCCALVDRLGADGAMTRVLIDTSPDLREQLLDAGVQSLDALVYTHDHADQTHGIDDVRALALRNRKAIPTFMSEATAASLVSRFRYCFEGAGGYPAILNFQPVIRPLIRFSVTGAGGDIELLPVDMGHGRIRCLGYRVGSMAYCNDVDDLPDATLAQLEGLEVLVVDALRYTMHPSHAHLAKALGWIARLAPRRAVLTNMHIDLDYQTLRGELPPGVEPGYDGMEIDFSL